MVMAIKLPDLGTAVEECRVLGWRVAEGAGVKRGQILADIETDKAVTELESTAVGVVLRLAVKAGELVRTGDILAYVGQPGESIPDAAKPGVSPVVPPSPKAKVADAPKPGAAVVSPSVVEPSAAVRISPMVRNLAAKLGVELSRVQGTGPGGMITREDVQRASLVLTE